MYPEIFVLFSGIFNNQFLFNLITAALLHEEATTLCYNSSSSEKTTTSVLKTL